MKKLLFLPILFVVLLSQAQTNLGIYPIAKPLKVLTTDTAQLSVLVNVASVTDTYKNTTVTQISGPNKAIIGTVNNYTNPGLPAIATVNITGTVPGTYTFQITGYSAAGQFASVTDSVIVSAPVPVVACPVLPKPRTLVSETFTLVNGIFQLTSVLYSDGQNH